MLRELAEVQYGVVARRQAREAGFTRWAIDREVANGTWEPRSEEVLRLRGAPPSRRQDLMAAVLDAGEGAVASYDSAAWLWRLPGFGWRHPEVSRLHGRSTWRPSLATIHWTRLLPPNHVTAVDGIPIVTLGRCLFDLAGRLHPDRTERLVEIVTNRNPSMLHVLHQLLDELGQRGRRGIGPMRAILAARPPGSAARGSGTELRFERILEDAGEPPLERQIDVGGHEWLGRIDYRDQSIGLLVEVQSRLHHTGLLARRRDEAREAALLAAGWREVLEVWEDEIWQRPWVALAKVRAARARLRAAA